VPAPAVPPTAVLAPVADLPAPTPIPAADLRAASASADDDEDEDGDDPNEVYSIFGRYIDVEADDNEDDDGSHGRHFGGKAA